MLFFTQSELLSRLGQSERRFVPLSQIACLKAPDAGIQEPNFLLFNREDDRLLAICPGHARVNARRLQRTTEPVVKAALVPHDEAEALGFIEARVHPFFLDPDGILRRIFIDAVLFTQSILFPESPIFLPVYEGGSETGKLLVPVRGFFAALAGIFGEDRIEVANLSDKSWPDPVLRELIRRRPVRTRFAPTPSNTLHLGNARGALIAALSALQDPDSEYFLRFDDTDRERNDEDCVAEIANELSWLGIDVPLSRRFRQSDAERLERYHQALAELAAAGLSVEHSDGSRRLRSLPAESYFNICFDWKAGPIVEHAAPATKTLEEKELPILRPASTLPYYRFSGTIDDIERSTHVFRDSRQAFLSKVQNHIRVALGLARLKPAERTYLHAHWQLPLPIYFHLPTVTDQEGKVLSKREGAGRFMLRALLEEGLPGDAVLILLLSTILPLGRDRSMREEIQRIATVLAGRGLPAAAKLLDLDSLVKSQHPIRLDLKKLKLAERAHLQAVSMAEFLRNLERRTGAQGAGNHPENTVQRLFEHRHDLASWEQANALLSFASSVEPQCQTALLTEAEQEWLSIRERRDAGADLMKLRIRLTGSACGPPLSTIFQVVGSGMQALRRPPQELKRS